MYLETFYSARIFKYKIWYVNPLTVSGEVYLEVAVRLGSRITQGNQKWKKLANINQNGKFY